MREGKQRIIAASGSGIISERQLRNIIRRLSADIMKYRQRGANDERE